MLFSPFFNGLIICVQPVKTWLQRSSLRGCIVYVVAAICGRWQPVAPGPLLIMMTWQRLAALIASVLSSSPVLLDSSSSLLFSLLLAQLPVFASASPVPPRRASDLDKLTNHTTNLKKLAQKLLVSADVTHPLITPPCMIEKRVNWFVPVGGERMLLIAQQLNRPLNGFSLVIQGFASGREIVWLTWFAQVPLCGP